jgi:hypothetical protein
MEGYKICHKLCAKYVGFLEQIRLEVQLHYEFKLKPEAEPHHDSKNKNLPATGVFDSKDLEAFMENAENLVKLSVKKTKWFPKFLNRVIPGKQKKVVVEKVNLLLMYVKLFGKKYIDSLNGRTMLHIFSMGKYDYNNNILILPIHNAKIFLEN